MSIASIDDPPNALRERIAAAMASPRLVSADKEVPQVHNADDFVVWQQAGNRMSVEAADAATNGITVALVVLAAHHGGDVTLSFPFESQSADSDAHDHIADIHVPCARFSSGAPFTERLRTIARTGVSGFGVNGGGGDDDDDELTRVAGAIGGSGLEELRKDLSEFAANTDSDVWLAAWIAAEDLSGVECAAHVLFSRPIGSSWHCCAVERLEMDGLSSSDEASMLCGAWSQVNDPSGENNYADSEKSLNALSATCRPVPGNPFIDMPVEPRCSCSRYTTDEALEEVSDMSEAGEFTFSAYAIALRLAHDALDGIRQFGQAQRKVFFAGLSELALSVASQGNEDALPVAKTAFGRSIRPRFGTRGRTHRIRLRPGRGADRGDRERDA